MPIYQRVQVNADDDLQKVTAIYPLGQAVGSSGYLALLPTIWSLLNYDSREENGEMELDDPPSRVSVQVWRAVTEHCSRTSAASATKMLSVEFVGRVLLVRENTTVGLVIFAHLCEAASAGSAVLGQLSSGGRYNGGVADIASTVTLGAWNA